VLTKDKLLAAAADANARNGSQMSAHQIASMFERTEILELLETYAREPSAGGSG
jgi:predicted transcriptional regulator